MNNRRAKTSLENIYLSIYLQGSKRFCGVLLWEGVGDRIELQYIDPHSYGRQRCVPLALQSCSTGGPGAQLSAGWRLSLLHLITNWSPKFHRGSRGPLRPGVAFPTTLVSNSVRSLTVRLPVLTELYNSSTPTQSPTQSLEWHVWSSSSGNNCHAVQRSLSSGASVYECTMGILTCPISSAKSAHAISFDYWPLECVTSFRCITLEWHVWPGRRSKYNTWKLCSKSYQNLNIDNTGYIGTFRGSSKIFYCYDMISAFYSISDLIYDRLID